MRNYINYNNNILKMVIKLIDISIINRTEITKDKILIIKNEYIKLIDNLDYNFNKYFNIDYQKILIYSNKNYEYYYLNTNFCKYLNKYVNLKEMCKLYMDNLFDIIKFDYSNINITFNSYLNTAITKAKFLSLSENEQKSYCTHLVDNYYSYNNALYNYRNYLESIKYEIINFINSDEFDSDILEYVNLYHS